VSNFPAATKLSPVWKNGVTDGVNWYLLENFLYFSDFLAHVEPNGISVPAGFITDFASVPRALWNIYPPWWTYGPAAIIHDWLYWDQKYQRSWADFVLHEAMIASGVDFVTRQAVFDAVALAGQMAWDENQRRKASGYTKMFTPETVT